MRLTNGGRTPARTRKADAFVASDGLTLDERRARDIAASFVGILREWLTTEQWHQMCAANRCEPNPAICHSHDYCDANIAMAEAFAKQGINVDVDDEQQLALWNAAWEQAMPALRGQR